MKIGILEIMPAGHYTLVDSIIRIYSSNVRNEIVVFTHEQGTKILSQTLDESIGNVNFVVKNESESLLNFFNKINQSSCDFLYIVTLEKYFNTVLNFNFNCSLNLFIHNIDAWFQRSLKYKIYNFFHDFTFSRKIIYKIKIYFIYPKLRERIINKLLNDNGRLTVLNKIIKNELKKYVDEGKIDVIPFSVFNKDIKDNSINNRCIRICIPGLISQVRRDYFSVLNMFEKELDFYKGKVELDLLGGLVKYEEGEDIIEQAKRLTLNGVKVHYYDCAFVPNNEYDYQLSKSDVILGNMNVDINKYSKYGKTKETGIIYNMIRAAKPGILPSSYALIDELKSSTIIYENYSALRIIINNLIVNKDAINSLKKEALKNSLLFTPSRIYNNIISD